ncbi:MAG: preprotein translocase subunit SecG [Clostridiales bacterium]|nr:preprotein translocase subunit SecG [Clostridiales bacterium]
MLWYEYVLGGLLLVSSVIVTIIILMQEGRSQGLSGVIGGNSDTFLSQGKGRTNEARLERLTKYLTIFFFVLVLASFLLLLFL